VPSDFSDYRLPPGRHGIPLEQARANQRWRLLGACAEVLAEGGYGALTIKAVIEAAAVSKATFYEQFEGLPECILATYEMAAANALAVTREACDSSTDPAAALPVAVSSVLAFLASEPALAHVLTDMALEDVRDLHPQRAQFARRCASMLAAAGSEQPDPDRHWRLSLHRVRATKGWLAIRLRTGTAAALPTRALELTQLLTA
jgi:AcrR family transcriptional regulator